MFLLSIVVHSEQSVRGMAVGSKQIYMRQVSHNIRSAAGTVARDAFPEQQQFNEAQANDFHQSWPDDSMDFKTELNGDGLFCQKLSQASATPGDSKPRTCIGFGAPMTPSIAFFLVKAVAVSRQ